MNHSSLVRLVFLSGSLISFAYLVYRLTHRSATSRIQTANEKRVQILLKEFENGLINATKAQMTKRLQKLCEILKEMNVIISQAQKEQEILPSGFYYGKCFACAMKSYTAIQALKQKSSRSNNVESTFVQLLDTLGVLSFELCSTLKQAASVSSTSLSPLVTYMVELPKLPVVDSSFLLEDGTLDWSKFTCEILLGGKDTTPIEIIAKKKQSQLERTKVPNKRESSEGDTSSLLEEEKYRRAAPYIKSAATAIHTAFKELSMDQFVRKYKPTFSLFGDVNILPSLFGLYKDRQYHLAFLLLIAHLDRALGDALFILGEGKQVIPKKLRLILTSPKMLQLLGPDKELLLQALIGPLQGINLRNLMWHGFMLHREFRIEYASMLFIKKEEASKYFYFLGLGGLTYAKNVETHGKHLEWIIQRKGITMLAEEPTKEEKKSIENLINNNYFVIPGSRQYWLDAFEHYYRRNYLYALALLFPQLEHSLRRVFVCVNKCTHALWTAESDILYSTLDILLAENLPDTNERNLLYDELGKGVMEVLLDIFVWFEGPRIRDKISHGSLDPKTLPTSLVQVVLSLSLSLCAKYSLQIDTQSSQFSFANYTSCFHPKVFLKREMMNFYHGWCMLNRNLLGKTTTQESFPTDRFDFTSAVSYLVSIIEDIGHHKIFKDAGVIPLFKYSGALTSLAPLDQNILDHWLMETSFTMYNTLPELSKIEKLRMLTKELANFSKSIRMAYERWEVLVQTRTANSGNRKNFSQLNEFLKYFSLMMCLMMLYVEYCLCDRRAYLGSSMETAEVINERIHRSADCFKCINSFAEHHKWRKCALLFCAFIGDTEHHKFAELSKRELAVHSGRFKY